MTPWGQKNVKGRYIDVSNPKHLSYYVGSPRYAIEDEKTQVATVKPPMRSSRPRATIDSFGEDVSEVVSPKLSAKPSKKETVNYSILDLSIPNVIKKIKTLNQDTLVALLSREKRDKKRKGAIQAIEELCELSKS